MSALSPSDWIQISGDSAIVIVTAIYVFFTWRLASLAKEANEASSRLLHTSHRIQRDARLPMYVLSCDYFQWSAPEPGEVDDGEYIMTWRITLLSAQPARLIVFRTAGVEYDVSLDGTDVTGPIHLAAQLGDSHTITWRVRVEPDSDPAGMQVTVRLDDVVETVADTVRLTAVWNADLAPVADVSRTYPGLDAMGSLTS